MSIAFEHVKNQIWEILSEIPDPEIPVVSIVDLGMVKNVTISNSGVTIYITPTYSGCPATEVIEKDIRSVLTQKGYKNVRVLLQHAPAWSTDSISSETKKRLKDYGITPPKKCSSSSHTHEKRNINCAYCDSKDVKITSEFGSTPCKALYFCNACLQPFEYFKCL